MKKSRMARIIAVVAAVCFLIPFALAVAFAVAVEYPRVYGAILR